MIEIISIIFALTIYTMITAIKKVKLYRAC